MEAKEGVAIQPENQTMASITFQNYFRLYGKLAGMTGTADTEAYEFQEIYGLETVVMPPNRPSRRDDQLDRVYKTTREKYEAAIKDIRDCYERGQPVLVGTTSIENSEIIAQLLEKENLPHQVLNAKQHAREADIVGAVCYGVSQRRMQSGSHRLWLPGAVRPDGQDVGASCLRDDRQAGRPGPDWLVPASAVA